MMISSLLYWGKPSEKLNTCSDYSSFYTLVEQEIQKEVNAICEKHRNLYIIPSPMMSLLMDGTIERAKDISEGSYYNNYGIHGTGIATATDTLAALEKILISKSKAWIIQPCLLP